MFIIEVIPIARSVGSETLSYFTSQEVPLGAIVTVPLRKKSIQGIVSGIRPAVDMKSEIKNASFALKKLEKIKSTEFFTASFMEMARTVADYYASSIGSVLDIIVPDYILKNTAKLKTLKKKSEKSEKSTAEKENRKKLHEKYAVQGDDDERYATWKSLIRQEFAKKKSLLFIFPTIEEAQYAFTLLEKGIEDYTFLLHGGLPQKKIIDSWNSIMKDPHPVVVITTGGFLSIPREDIETIVVERESNKSYKIPRRPFLDVRHIAEILAEKRGIKIFFADNFLRLETLWRTDKTSEVGIEKEILEASPFQFRSLSTARDSLVDMRQPKGQRVEQNGKREGKTAFKIFSEEVKNLIVRTRDQSEHMIILAVRRGTSPSTICGDCQSIVVCNHCSSPVVLHGTSFMCHRCGERRSAEENCLTCGSWKLGAIGIGIDLVEKKIKDKFPDISLFHLDSDTVSNDKEAHAVIQKYRAKPGSILLGTEMMLQYIHEKSENSAIISLDSLFSLPDFRIQEKILYMLTRMRTLTSRDFIVQTRKAEEKVFEYGLKGNMSDFYRTSIEEREKFNYPPFSTLIKLTLEGKKNIIVKDMEEAQTILEPYEVEVFPAFTHTIKGNYVLHGLIRLSRDKWIDPNLLDKLRSLPPSVTVKVDPETLL